MSFFDERFADHREAWELIPWVVNGTATEQERALVHAHLAGCADCTSEFRFQSELRTDRARHIHAGCECVSFLSKAEHPAGQCTGCERDVPSALCSLHRQAHAAGRCGARGRMPDRAQHGTVGCVGRRLVWRLIGRSAPAQKSPRHATIRAVLDPALSVGELQAMLAELRLQIVAGPSAAGVYSLAPEAGASSASTAQTVSKLRSRTGVRFAEPTDGGTERR